MQAILVRPDWQTIENVITRQRRQTPKVLFGGLLLILLIISVAQRGVDRIVFQAILVDGGTWGTAWFLAVWYALRYRPERTRMALLSGAAVALIFTLANILPKWNVESWIPDDMRTDPILFWGAWHCLILCLLRWFVRRYPRETRAAGLSLDNWQRKLGYSILGGAVLAGHFVFSIAFTGSKLLDFPPLPDFSWQFFFEIASTLSTELFFRGTIYRYLERERAWGFWRAAVVSAMCNLSVFLVKLKWTDDLVTTLGVVFYIFIMSMINAAIYHRSRSLFPCYISALVFNLAATMEQGG